MYINRLFKLFVFTLLVVVIGLTVREAAATTAVISQANSAETVCSSLPSGYSIHTEYVQEKGAWVTYTEDGPTGVDGGLIQLLSDNRACSK
jgi:hypothetical protein